MLPTLLFGLLASSVPTLANVTGCKDPCMSYREASRVANNFQTLIANYSDALADRVLTVDFNDWSDSVTTLIDSGCSSPQPLGSVTFDSRDSFKKGQGSQPAIPFQILNLWYACDGPVVIRWRSTQEPEIITGNIVLETKRSGDYGEPWLIKTVYSEFNSGAWLVNLGVFKPTCNSTAQHNARRAAPMRIRQ
ncbi:hypothetical protein K470DRAFT_258575 [Piedraia hortae CBS 480.64]|uniref:NTF2-like domain-containing protein n=1 Tax=Piedraia hortae CBS 480.64 TaxID=1314780 RepID=A0A6A7BWY7_9PEZI|nr:hypothetical protein K470DRAFT_258575 [Piedraia hortae CBS 480.64]